MSSIISAHQIGHPIDLAFVAGPPSQDKRRPYFPRIGAKRATRSNGRPLPERPDKVGPIFDHDNAKRPLPKYDASSHQSHYAKPCSKGTAEPPAKPAQSSDQYLVPSLSRDEHLRLTVLWYYTRGITEDEYFLFTVDAIAASVHETMGWEYVSIGILDEAVYTCLATANLPITLLPRRESICSHTINQSPRSVFMSTDLTGDWRFQGAPQVRFGGLRSYAGTQLVVVTEDGTEIALGTLYVASGSNEKPLSSKQQTALMRFADIVSWEITERTRQLRFRERGVIMDSLLELHSQMDRANFSDLVTRALQQQYPDAHVSIQDASTEEIEVQGRPSVTLKDIDETLWEDTSFVEAAITNQNFERLTASQTVRMLNARCGATGYYLVVCTDDIHHILDDTDVWFVEKCAAAIAEAHHKRLMIQALEAKEAFLRNITHQLRTPVHGILGSVDLLAEELPSRLHGAGGKFNRDANQWSYITTIRNSARELMATINNILRFNALTTQADADGTTKARYDLRNMDHEVLAEVLQLVPEDQMLAVSIKLDNRLTFDQSMIEVDGAWLKECIQPLLLNGLQSVHGHGCGIASMTTSYDSDREELCFDVKDTGIGIKPADQQRIFTAFEKVDDHRTGAGLGLTLARRIAEMHGGSISLVTSLQGHGSHFRALFPNRKLSAPSVSPALQGPNLLRHLPRTFFEMRYALTNAHMLDHLADHLSSNGFRQSQNPDTGLIISDVVPDMENLDSYRINPARRTVMISYCTHHTGPRIQKPTDRLTVLVVSGPFHASRLDDLLRQADVLYSEMTDPVDTLDIPSPSLSPSPSPASQVTTASTAPSTPMLTPIPTKALLVDDNLINLRILEMFCKKRRIPYVTATDGLKAEEEFSKALYTPDPIDITLMDLQMPRCGGIEATRAIRSKEAGAKSCRSPIFVVTGQDSPSDKAQSQEAGADEFLVKPVELKVFDRYIAKYFSGYNITAPLK